MDLCYGKLNESVEANSIYAPAHAGIRKTRVLRCIMRRDHPRTRGEKTFSSLSEVLRLGSPPPTRGKDKLMPEYRRALGITPAHAGKSRACPMPPPDSQDHPRLRGEKFHLRRDLMEIRGSPPPTRGKVFAVRFDTQTLGITPAHAGKSHRDYRRRNRQRDHPRTRGEKTPFPPG